MTDDHLSNELEDLKRQIWWLQTKFLSYTFKELDQASFFSSVNQQYLTVLGQSVARADFANMLEDGSFLKEVEKQNLICQAIFKMLSADSSVQKSVLEVQELLINIMKQAQRLIEANSRLSDQVGNEVASLIKELLTKNACLQGWFEKNKKENDVRVLAELQRNNSSDQKSASESKEAPGVYLYAIYTQAVAQETDSNSHKRR